MGVLRRSVSTVAAATLLIAACFGCDRVSPAASGDVDGDTDTDGDTDSDTDADSDGDTDDCTEPSGLGECPPEEDLSATQVTSTDLGKHGDSWEYEGCNGSLATACEEIEGLTCFVVDASDKRRAVVASDAEAMDALTASCSFTLGPDFAWGDEHVVIWVMRHICWDEGDIKYDYRLSEHADGRVHVDAYHWRELSSSTDNYPLTMYAAAVVETDQVPTVCLRSGEPCPQGD
jgi:hypothetical protein